MGSSRKSLLRQSALVSGLLTRDELDAAYAELEEEMAHNGKPPTDERLADRLVKLGQLNKWQAEQLRGGRTKFNLGPYQMIDSIGRGGMGEVYKAEHSIMGRVVAVKVLPRHKSTPDAISNFSREIRAQAQLDHENLVRAFDAGQEGNVYFLVTEYVPGTDLRRLIRRQGRLSMAVASSIGMQAARGLEHAHARGLIHRDVKPGNILVTPEGRTKVSDLGLAGYFTDNELSMANEKKVVGTADYLSPEQILTPDRLTPASDVYSLGCTLYYAITGKVPFPGGTARDKARRHCQTPPLDPRRLNSDLSDDFVEILAEMMVKQVDKRVQTAGEVAERLAEFVADELPLLAQEPSSPAPMPAPQNIPPVRRAIPASQEAEINFLVQPSEDFISGDTPSQQSLGTQPMYALSEETEPVFLSHELSPFARRMRMLDFMGDLPLAIKILILIAIATVLFALTAVVLRLF